VAEGRAAGQGVLTLAAAAVLVAGATHPHWRFGAAGQQHLLRH
jgi:hypothetical protein